MTTHERSLFSSVLLSISLAVGCATPGHPAVADGRSLEAADGGLPALVPAARRPVATKRVVLVTVDGVRWQEVFHGVDPRLAREAGLPPSAVVGASALLPNLYGRIAARGLVLGAPGRGLFEASGPVFVSQPGYQEIFAGTATGCRSNACGPTTVKTLPEDLADAHALGEVASIASWEQIELAVARDASRIVVSAGRLGGKTRDKVAVDDEARKLLDAAATVPAYPGLADYRPDTHTGELALRYYRARRPVFLHVGLGDPDEYAHRADYPGYLRSIRETDAFLGRLADAVLEGPDGESTTILVTADHGRNDDFANHGKQAESARVFLFAAGGAVPSRGYVTTRETLHLADIAPTIRALLDLETSRAIASFFPLPGR